MSLRPPPGLHRRPVLEPQCTHLNMTRLYDPEALCCMCHRPGRFGWVYQCTQDQENLIEHAVSQTGLVRNASLLALLRVADEEQEVFDHLGQDLCAQLTLRERSPAAREDRRSFFTEITPQQMSQYRPDQIATILKQRENVRNRTFRLLELADRTRCKRRSRKTECVRTALAFWASSTRTDLKAKANTTSTSPGSLESMRFVSTWSAPTADPQPPTAPI